MMPVDPPHQEVKAGTDSPKPVSTALTEFAQLENAASVKSVPPETTAANPVHHETAASPVQQESKASIETVQLETTTGSTSQQEVTGPAELARTMSAMAPEFIPQNPFPSTAVLTPDTAAPTASTTDRPRQQKQNKRRSRIHDGPLVPLPHPDDIRARFAEGGIPMDREEVHDLVSYECYINGRLTAGGPGAVATSLYDRHQYILAGGNPDRPKKKNNKCRPGKKARAEKAASEAALAAVDGTVDRTTKALKTETVKEEGINETEKKEEVLIDASPDDEIIKEVITKETTANVDPAKIKTIKVGDMEVDFQRFIENLKRPASDRAGIIAKSEDNSPLPTHSNSGSTPGDNDPDREMLELAAKTQNIFLEGNYVDESKDNALDTAA